ncbi:Nucleoside-diphosphate-sugar epimerase [Mycolicibacterium rutilum]|uniref:Nucleoside-diphosphate-sugar epimerase n=1 Tax=Mycolicibacterium rutilum TaxID=370526 RepID=A0A1H6INU7_MYCRU|nr:NAD(P)-dependent oxidoreductase [Mycolicibacterium rutilum]SEH47992.1 Nucleoside-diphosphate-sugar epimerase [Mycolicibacterium rutilum]
MRILLAGASGVIGRPLLQRLRGHEIVGLVHSAAGAKAVESSGATALLADALDRDALLRAVEGQRADVVVHQLTGYRNAPPTRYGGKGVRRTNALRTTGTANILEAAATVGARRFVTQSLILGYGLTDHGAREITEEQPFEVLRGDRSDPAITAMADAENLAFAADVDAVALRYGIFYGPGASDMFVTMLKRRMLPLPSPGTGSIGWIHIDDAVEATAVAIENVPKDRAYNIVDDEPAGWDVMLDAMAAAVGAPRPLRLPAALVRLGAPFAASQMLDMSMRVSNERAARELEWRPKFPSYRDGLRTLAS